MASNKDDVLLALAYRNRLTALLLLQISKKKRSCWVRKLWQYRKQQGHFDNLVQEIRLYDHSVHFNYFRMLPSTFDDLLRLVQPVLSKQRSRFREPLSPALKLAVTLRYLATGESQASLSYNFRIGRSTVCEILDDFAEKIWAILSPISVTLPKNEDAWKKIANDFWHLWGFPLCVIDCKHCIIICPKNSGSAFFNYKGSFFVVLMAVADASYMFTYVDIGDYGRQCDSSVFNNSNFGKALVENSLGIPESDYLPGTTMSSRYCFIGDEAFPLRANLQRPVPGRGLPEISRIYNYRLSRARRVVENAFGILSARWRLLRAPIQAQPEKASKYILAAVALHNWLKKHNDSQIANRRNYCPPGYTDYGDAHGILHEGIWRSEVKEASSLSEITKLSSNNHSKTAQAFRQQVAEYFLSAQGELPWQYDYVKRTAYEPAKK